MCPSHTCPIYKNFAILLGRCDGCRFVSGLLVFSLALLVDRIVPEDSFSLPKLSNFRFWAVKHVFVMLYIFGASLYFLYGDRVTREFAPFLSFRH